ncbi:hypothetical protein [Cupriavidus oxalaticus]|uniref:Membrane lipoprotein, cell wall extensin motif n=1 Tax=Cupriavidus oxalaticus TaxID=96344 RepID=A0A375FJG6_9BURK|nr:hypothetical protein [Cupriavidus oxalaticus]QRQ85866.1 hypothetical protein JTE91_21655 [Cupriavidus oxalaticus]QRQ95808.1 hypothetical protein JTE92_20605 [Cupriavidus oxalaticus]WQD84479.1 hypothetical protein U0036_08345 [Cupriavidus oxalaticus]SPC06609.1 conserved exported hypothetical protein [Cupriavidus oxalaticus]SPC12410.1 conserved exported hypothetical protein [Cupriavidus oxalaticus]
MSRHFISLLLLAGLSVTSAIAYADPWKDESGHGHGRKYKGGDYKEEYWDGSCKVERKWEKNGEYKEERKCKDRPAAYHPPGAVYYPEPAIVVSPQVIIRP